MINLMLDFHVAQNDFEGQDKNLKIELDKQ